MFHICLSIFLLELRFQVFIPVLFLEILGLGLDHFERRESEERRWLGGHRSLLLQLLWYLPRRRRRQSRLEVLLCAVGEAVAMVVVVVVAVLVAVQDMFIRAEVVGFGILLQLMRLVAPVLSVLVLVVVVVVMEPHFLLFLLKPLPLVIGRRQVPFLLFLLLFEKSIKTVPHLFF